MRNLITALSILALTGGIIYASCLSTEFTVINLGKACNKSRVVVEANPDQEWYCDILKIRIQSQTLCQLS